MFNLVRDKYIAIYSEEYLFHMIENYVLLKMIEVPSFDYPKDVEPKQFKKFKSVLKNLNL